ncbi:UDP-N-acetyl-D-mannosamine dehydrogenase [Paenibacillus sp. BSR1-1]|uniref:UDP-N-acetyl-D-mannosamine dehydrogenase n=1 Tax=Paenibacillus sp. BSR1-1 TaxID=3020845 RepID=UPI0025B0E602|nr:UDP-N-acetyl-D-mannosamine dehydrogenase [Paenibacillus sp. BSR1-1]MDN3019176.1 UDP-N-acetyl-D-mannosamine dehydrogenase [Paenibacillus sp. BSR1-1]
MEKVSVIGLGYIGLPTAAVLADHGFKVHGVDVNEKAVELINSGKSHIYEPDLDIKVKKAVENGLLVASTTPVNSDVFIIAVPTPFKDNHKPDLTYVESATKTIAPYIKSGNIVILESTSPVGTTEKIAEWIKQLRPDLNIKGISNQVYIAHCPERVLPGKILEELIWNDRIIGGISEESTEKTVFFYRKFVKGELLKTNARTAEMSKLTENSFRDVNIAFANELSLICDQLNIDVWELIKLANHHPRVNILQPGPGVGGHCIAVDPWFIVDAAPETSQLIHTARKVNDSKPEFVINKVIKAVKKLKKPRVSILGLAFKPNIDDLRESPAVEIVSELSQLIEGEIFVVEPHIEELPNALKGKSNLTFTNTIEAIENSDIVVFLVGHDNFKQIDSEILMDKIIIDTIGIFPNSNRIKSLVTH